MNGKGYGMPSSHAQFLTYFSISLTLFLLLRHRPPLISLGAPAPRSANSAPPIPLPHRLLLSFLSILAAIAVALSRIYLTYHTTSQVLAGCAAGAVSAVGWFGITWYVRREGWVEWGLESWGGRWGRWRDLVVEEDLVEGGWGRWEERMGERRRERVGRGRGRGVNGGVGGEGRKGR